MNIVRVRYTDIIRTVSEILTARFDKDVYDVVEDFPRACFMTNLHIAETEAIMSNHIRDNMTLTIYYFPSDEDNNTAENAIMQEDLKELIFVDLDGLLPVNKKLSLEIMEYRGAVVDGVLQIKLDLTMNHKIRTTKSELMENISVKYN